MSKKREPKNVTPDLVAPAYRAQRGLNYGPADTRVEAGEPLPADFPATSLPWLLKRGWVLPAEADPQQENNDE